MWQLCFTRINGNANANARNLCCIKNNTIIGTRSLVSWVITFGTLRMELGVGSTRLVPSSQHRLYSGQGTSCHVALPCHHCMCLFETNCLSASAASAAAAGCVVAMPTEGQTRRASVCNGLALGDAKHVRALTSIRTDTQTETATRRKKWVR